MEVKLTWRECLNLMFGNHNPNYFQCWVYDKSEGKKYLGFIDLINDKFKLIKQKQLKEGGNGK